MRKGKRIIAFVLCLLWLLSGMTAGAASTYSGTHTSLPPGTLIGDESGLITETTEYLIDVSDLRAGDRVSKTITIRNDMQGSPFYLSIVAHEGVSSGPIPLLDKTQLVLYLDGVVMYKGPLRGHQGVNSENEPVTMLGSPIDLGVYYPNEPKEMMFELTLDPDLDPSLFYGQSEGRIKWEVVAVRNEETSPETGVTVQQGLAVFCGLLIISTFVLMFFAKRKKRSQHTQEGTE